MVVDKFSGWKVVAGCFLLMFFGMAVVINTSALFMSPITTEFGFSTASYSIINLISSLTGAIAAVILAPKMQKGNMKLIMVIASCFAAITYATMGFCSELWQFILVFGACNFAVGGISQLSVSMLITSWFQDKRSIAMSIAFSGAGLGGAIWAMLFSGIIENYGWRYCYYIGAGIVVVFATISILLFIKKTPAECGQTPYVNKAGKAVEGVKKEIWFGLAKKEAVKTTSFGMLIAVMLLLGFLAAGVATHSVNYLGGIGWGTAEAGSVLSVFNIVLVLGMFLGGVLFEKIGVKGGTFISVIFAIIGITSLIFAEIKVFGYLYAIFFALAMMLPKMLPAIITSTVFGVKDYGSMYSYLNIFFLVGASLGSVITGIINQTAGYAVAWITYIICAALLFVFTYLALATSKKLRDQYPNPAAAS